MACVYAATAYTSAANFGYLSVVYLCTSALLVAVEVVAFHDLPRPLEHPPSFRLLGSRPLESCRLSSKPTQGPSGVRCVFGRTTEMSMDDDCCSPPVWRFRFACFARFLRDAPGPFSLTPLPAPSSRDTLQTLGRRVTLPGPESETFGTRPYAQSAKKELGHLGSDPSRFFSLRDESTPRGGGLHIS